MKRGTEIASLRSLIVTLEKGSKKAGTSIWADLAERLSRPSRQMAEVQLGRLTRLVKDGETVVVPGKVLGGAPVTRKVKVAAWRFSADAKARLVKAGGSAMDIKTLMAANPSGSGVRIIE